MKLKFLIFYIILLFNPSLTKSQTAQAKITYLCENKLAKDKGYNGLNTLYFNDDRALFLHNEYPKLSEQREIGNFLKITVGDKEEFPIYIDKKEGLVYFKVARLLGNISLVLIEETLTEIAWKITNKTKKLGDLMVVSAEGEFGGRMYDVWFCPQIPTSFGPYKLMGLPGAILEAKSRDGIVSYTFLSFSNDLEETKTLEKPSNFTSEMTWEEFVKARISRKKRIEGQSNATQKLSIPDMPINYDVEKGKFTLFEDMKK